MKCSAERLIEALVAVDLAQERKAVEEQARAARRASYVVTVSRGYGSLGKQMALKLADRLGVRCCDRMILEAVAKRAAVDLDLVRKLDETVRRAGIEPWKAMFAGRTLSDQRFQDHLVKVILNIAKQGGVIVGRGAHLILGPEQAFRVRISGSLDVCAARVAEREQIDLADARERVQAIDRQRDAYLRKYFGASVVDCSDYDLVLNSDRFSIEQMIGLVLSAMQQSGYEITPDILNPA